MLLYARSDVAGFSGVGDCPGHYDKADPDDDHFSVDCETCHPFLAADPLWAANPAEVPLTVAQQKQIDAEQHEAQLGAAQMGMAFQELLRKQLLPGTTDQQELEALRARVAELEGGTVDDNAAAARPAAAEKLTVPARKPTGRQARARA